MVINLTCLPGESGDPLHSLDGLVPLRGLIDLLVPVPIGLVFLMGDLLRDVLNDGMAEDGLYRLLVVLGFMYDDAMVVDIGTAVCILEIRIAVKIFGILRYVITVTHTPKT